MSAFVCQAGNKGSLSTLKWAAWRKCVWQASELQGLGASLASEAVGDAADELGAAGADVVEVRDEELLGEDGVGKGPHRVDLVGLGGVLRRRAARKVVSMACEGARDN